MGQKFRQKCTSEVQFSFLSCFIESILSLLLFLIHSDWKIFLFLFAVVQLAWKATGGIHTQGSGKTERNYHWSYHGILLLLLCCENRNAVDHSGNGHIFGNCVRSQETNMYWGAFRAPAPWNKEGPAVLVNHVNQLQEILDKWRLQQNICFMDKATPMEIQNLHHV